MLVALFVLRYNIRRCKCIPSTWHVVVRRWTAAKGERNRGLTRRSSHRQPLGLRPRERGPSADAWLQTAKLRSSGVPARHRILWTARSSIMTRRVAILCSCFVASVNEDNTKLRRTSFTYLTFGRPKRSVAQSYASLMYLLVFDDTCTCQVLYDVLYWL